MRAPPPGRTLRVRRRLLGFYDTSARELPWRGEADPYRIWISEVMLQQTRVDTVIDYYRRWMARFPDVTALADAGMEAVLQQWKGLGYYSRARNLREAARLVRERHAGRLPASVPELRELPGIGEYTAGAIASIAFSLPAPAVDGNVRRVLARFFDLPDPPPAELRALATALVDPDRPGDFNQALMELGATVCVPRSPRCTSCPLEDLCEARSAGTVAERPLPRKKVAVREVVVGVGVVLATSPPGRGTGAGRHRVLLRRRPEGGLLPGLWEFPGEEVDGGEAVEAAARRAVEASGMGRSLHRRARSCTGALPEVVHRFTHLEARYRPILFEPGDSPPDADGSERRWVDLDALDSVPLSTAQQRIGKALIEEVRRREEVG